MPQILPSPQVLCTSGLLLIAAFFLFGALRNYQARQAVDIYVKNFSELADDENVPLPILESLHLAFKTSCHSCAVLFVLRSAIGYKFSPSYRKLVEEKEQPRHLENLDPKVIAKISATIVSLFLYTTYSVPILGLIARPILKKAAQKSQDGDRGQMSRRVKLFVFSAEHAAANTQ
jgi:hypothetical protein